MDNAIGFPNIRWIVIYPIDSAIQHFNNQDQEWIPNNLMISEYCTYVLMQFIIFMAFNYTGYNAQLQKVQVLVLISNYDTGTSSTHVHAFPRPLNITAATLVCIATGQEEKTRSRFMFMRDSCSHLVHAWSYVAAYHHAGVLAIPRSSLGVWLDIFYLRELQIPFSKKYIKAARKQKHITVKSNIKRNFCFSAFKAYRNRAAWFH